MSTRLLRVHGKVHELSDDLESHFFVLLFEGLHLVEHNSPGGVFMQEIFDHVNVDPKTGNHTGGGGKVILYSTGSPIVNHQLEFTSKPFTALIRELYRLFKSLHQYHTAKEDDAEPNNSDAMNVKKLEGCTDIAALFDKALKSEEWPTECDKALDQYPPTNRLKPEEKDTVALSYVNKSVRPEPSSGKRKRELEPEVQPRRSTREKRSKVVSYQY